MSATIRVEIVYALPQRQELVEVQLPEGATARQAIEASGLLEKYPDIELDRRNKLGIYAKLVKADSEVRDRDRVEIYRPLIADPKAVRKKRADEGKVMKKGGGSAEEEAWRPAGRRARTVRGGRLTAGLLAVLGDLLLQASDLGAARRVVQEFALAGGVEAAYALP